MTQTPRHPEPVDAAHVPRFGGIPTFVRMPHVTDPAQLDIALIGVPWDGTGCTAQVNGGQRGNRS